ncbi:unnamed protein product [Prunus armeniaca]|uniref:GAG-pre-integrase domain-containing protein n=1 Tax=Prunus armeniaca TaxID=36596 RepID=A0A6J5Y846_PRUAR|nr:unnamed protein product [Prunus armeniaca]
MPSFRPTNYFNHRITCQLCFQKGHTGLTCRNGPGHSFSSHTPPLRLTTNHYTIPTPFPSASYVQPTTSQMICKIFPCTLSILAYSRSMLPMVKDLVLGKLLYQGPTEESLYPIHLSKSSSNLFYLHAKAPSPLWHQRLGHPSQQVLRQLLAKNKINVTDSLNQLPLYSDC